MDVVNRYATALDARDWDLLDRVFTPDAIGDFGEYQLRGPEQIKQMVRGMLGGCGPTQHLLGNHRIEVDGDAARCVCSVRAFHAGLGDRADQSYELFAEYRDRLERAPEGWRIAKRSVRITWERGSREVLGPA